MKKILKTILLATALTSSLMAEIIFDLGAQQLSESQKGSYKLSSYDLGKSIVSTGLASGENGAYQARPYSSGSFTAQIKEPKSNWGVTFNMYCYLYDDGCGTTLIDEDGNTINIALERSSISVEGNQTIIDTISRTTNIQGSIHTIKNSNEIEIIINGAYKYRVTKPNFKIAQITLSIATDNSNLINMIDKIHSLVISASDN